MLSPENSTTLAVEPWSLDSCVNYAISHNITVQSRMLEAEGGRLSVTEAKDRFLPTVSGYGSQSFSFGRGLTAENTYANRNTSSFSAGAQLSLPIFQGLAGGNCRGSTARLRRHLPRPRGPLPSYIV